MKPKLVISKCLGFENCRYNGQTIPDKFVDKMTQYADVITVCPEVEIGLGIPRQPVRLGRDGDTIRMIQPATEEDVTEKMADFTKDFLGSLECVDGFIMKNRSPSCGINDVKVYHNLEKLSAANRGSGFFGGQLETYFPLSAIEDEGRLKNLPLREHFLTKLYTIARFREVQKAKTAGALVKFQTEHKYLFMAYNQSAYREAGKIVANHEHYDMDQVLALYQEKLVKILAKPAKSQANINAIHHIFGGFSKNLGKEEKQFFLNTVEEYRDERIGLTTIIHMLKAYAIRFESKFVMDQVFLNPYPDYLVNLSNSGKK